MKKILGSLFVFLSLLQANASDGTVVLELSEYNNLKVPEYKTEAFKTINQDGELASNDDDYCPSYMKENSNVFENKTGQIFENFINEKVIDKKPNIFSSPLKQMQNIQIQQY